MNVFGQLDWGNWFLGMWVAIATGFSTAGIASFALYFQNPSEHNPTHSEFWVSAGIIMAMTSGKDFLLYISQNPTPKIKTTTSVTATDSSGSSVTMKQTVEPATESQPKV